MFIIVHNGHGMATTWVSINRQKKKTQFNLYTQWIIIRPQKVTKTWAKDAAQVVKCLLNMPEALGSFCSTS